MRTALVILGIILLIMGLVFVGQGSGYFPYPASSFMIGQPRWLYYGAGIAVLGLILIIVARGENPAGRRSIPSRHVGALRQQLEHVVGCRRLAELGKNRLDAVP